MGSDHGLDASRGTRKFAPTLGCTQVCLPLDTLIGYHYNVPDLLSDFSANPKSEVECVCFRWRAGKRPRTASARTDKGRPGGTKLSLRTLPGNNAIA